MQEGYFVRGSRATFLFHHIPGMNRLTIHAQPATRVTADVRSLLDMTPPCEATDDGKLKVMRNFSGAWFWDGTDWHNLGSLASYDASLDWKTATLINPWNHPVSGHYIFDGTEDNDFPSMLKPLLDPNTLKAMLPAGDCLFLGVEPIGDVLRQNEDTDGIISRRVVAYQFHMKKSQRHE